MESLSNNQKRLVVAGSKMLGFEKDDKDLPPTYDSTLQQTLKASSHGVELIIPTPPSGTFLPGDVVRGRVGIPNDILNSMEGGLRCRLEGKSSVEVMGKSRYQVRPHPILFSVSAYFRYHPRLLHLMSMVYRLSLSVVLD